ncbi:M23 family metallopeptidase [Roseivirga pacifica]|uniref:M23 family metallopeptidase n=1 Tax=Roseivirga pacifica TaxID=1267423 RepID=UPI00227A6B04|nr:M23 family metallopeptidase [Roseivirga pacifica]
MTKLFYSLSLLLLSIIQATAQEDFFKVYYEQTDTTISIYADNSGFMPVSVTLTLDLKGLKPTQEPSEYYIIEGKTATNKLIDLVIPEGRSWNFKYHYNYYLGKANAVHNDDFVYQLPFEVGKTWPLTQGYNGRSTHMGENALDFTMPSGEKILAARGGKVVAIKEDSDRGCPSPSCNDYGNYIRILHDDGTIADYLHLQQNGALVNLGDEVEKGQHIGLSGGTGWASGPHLHFMVYKYEGSKRISYETKFQINPREIGYLEEGKRYKGN